MLVSIWDTCMCVPGFNIYLNKNREKKILLGITIMQTFLETNCKQNINECWLLLHFFRSTNSWSYVTKIILCPKLSSHHILLIYQYIMVYGTVIEINKKGRLIWKSPISAGYSLLGSGQA